MHHSIRRATLLAALTALIIPLNAKAQVTAQPAPAGAYKLAQVDSVNLPVVIREEGGCKDEVTAATLTLAADNTWKFEGMVRRTCGTTVEEKTTTEEGKYEMKGDTIDLDPDGEPDQEQDKDPTKVDIGELATATIHENELRVKLEEDVKVLVFRK